MWKYYDGLASKFQNVPSNLVSTYSHQGAAYAEPIVFKNVNSLDFTVQSVRSYPDLQSNLELLKSWVLGKIHSTPVPSFNLSQAFCGKDV